MNEALLFSALLMGLAGTPHCLAMCGAACTAATGGGQGSGLLAFHLGRGLAYAAAGAVAAASVGTLAALGSAVGVLRPLWSLVHIAAIALGLVLLWQGRQPAWLERLGRSRLQPAAVAHRGGTWQRVRGPGRSAAAGLAWVAWPCGLLQSALLVAALANTPAQGAAVMGVFAFASAAGLVAGPLLWARLGPGATPAGAAGGRLAAWLNPSLAVRLAGASLAGASAWALGHGVWMRVAAWCFS